MAGNSQDDTLLKKQALHKARSLVDKLEMEDASLGWHKEKQLLLLLGVVAIAVVGFVGLSMMMGGSKEKDLDRHRCEQEFVVKSVWDYTEALKKQQPAAAAAALAAEVDKKRAEFKDAAKAACAKGK